MKRNVSIESHINAVLRAAALTDAGDLPGLVALQGQLQDLGNDASIRTADSLVTTISRASELIERIVLREVEDSSAALAAVVNAVAHAGEGCKATGPGGETPGSAPCRDGIDEQLRRAWLTGCSASLGDLEADVLEVDGVFSETTLPAVIRRRVRTLEYECELLSLPLAQQLCHDVETLIEQRLNAARPFPVDAVLALIDWFRTYLARLEQTPTSPPPPHERFDASLTDTPPLGDACSALAVIEAADGPAASVTVALESFGPPDQPVALPDLLEDENIGDFLEESREHLAVAEDALLGLEQRYDDLELINTVFRSFHTLKGVAGFMHVTPIVRIAHQAEFLLDAARQRRLTIDTRRIDLILRSCDTLMELIGAIEGVTPPLCGQLDAIIAELAAAADPHAEPPPAPLALAAAPGSGSTDSDDEVAADGEQPDDVAAPPIEPPARRASPRGRTVRVGTGRLDTLSAMVGDLREAHQALRREPSIESLGEPRVRRNLAEVGRIIGDLQDVATSLRMVALQSTFKNMARIVHDVSKTSGKRIIFHTRGEDTELDRTLVDEIAGPLVHMIRNACDHGIEPVSDRLAAGKTPEGNLTLQVQHQRNSIVIEVRDDGRGLNKERIVRNARERGLVSSRTNVSTISDSEIHDLVLQPGVSTAELVTDISGRGVGLDVVRRNIEALGGTIEIRSTPGAGSTFRIRLPLTVAAIDGTVVRIGSQRYVIPTRSIEASFQPTADQRRTVAVCQHVSIAGSMLPVHRLESFEEPTDGATNPPGAALLVLGSGNQRRALLVGEILGRQQVVIKSPDQQESTSRDGSTGVLLDDGRVALLVEFSDSANGTH